MDCSNLKILHIDSNHPLLWEQLLQAGFQNEADFTSSKKEIEAKWSYKILNMSVREVAFFDDSHGEINSWNWDFGDGTTATEQNPIHQYKEAGKYVVILKIQGPKGESKLSKVWDVAVK